MKVLVACEYSNIVADAFRRKGHKVTSVDLIENDFPSQDHIVGNVFDVLRLMRFDLMIAHPPCTYLCNAQIHKFYTSPGRWCKSIEATNFVKQLYNSDVPRVCIENPKGVLSSKFCPPAQIVYPWYFGDPYSKDICLWLKNLSPLISTVYSTGRKSMSNHVNSRMSQEQKSKIKSKFFPGIASAMAEQWGAV